MQWLFALIPLLVVVAIGYHIFTNTPLEAAKKRLSNLTLIEMSPDIFLELPVIDEAVPSPLSIAGTAYSDDGALHWRIRSEENVILAAGTIDLGSGTEWMIFEEQLFLPEIANHLAILELYTKKEGNLDKALMQRGLLVESNEVLEVQVYYREEARAKEDCTAIAYQERRFGFTEEKEFMTLLELLKGPTATWALNLVPEGADLVSVTRQEGLARVDFTGSTVEDWFIEGCDVSPGFLQITQTLEQFEGIEAVEIWIDEVKLTRER